MFSFKKGFGIQISLLIFWIFVKNYNSNPFFSRGRIYFSFVPAIVIVLKYNFLFKVQSGKHITSYTIVIKANELLKLANTILPSE